MAEARAAGCTDWWLCSEISTGEVRRVGGPAGGVAYASMRVRQADGL